MKLKSTLSKAIKEDPSAKRIIFKQNWLKIAAAVLLLLMAGTFLFQPFSNSNQQVAQNAYVNVKVGVNGIYNVGETDIKQMFNDFTEESPGYQFGVEYGAKLVSILGFRGEGNYVNGKFSYETDRQTTELPNGTMGSFNIKEKMNVINQGIQIPTSLTLDLGMLDFNVGPNFEFLFSSIATGSLDASNLDSLSQSIPSTDIDYDFFNDPANSGAYFDQAIKDGSLFNKFNVGLNLGIGANLGKLRVDLKTNYTLTDAVNDYYQSNQGETVDRPISFHLSGVYRLFSLGGDDDEDNDDKKEDDDVDLLFPMVEMN